MRLREKMEKIISDCHTVNDDNLEKILLEIPPLIEQSQEFYSHKQVVRLMEIYLGACIYIGHYTRPYHTLKEFDDLTAELNDEMYTGNLDYSPLNTKSHRTADLSTVLWDSLFHFKDEKRIHFC